MTAGQQIALFGAEPADTFSLLLGNGHLTAAVPIARHAAEAADGTPARAGAPSSAAATSSAPSSAGAAT